MTVLCAKIDIGLILLELFQHITAAGFLNRNEKSLSFVEKLYFVQWDVLPVSN